MKRYLITLITIVLVFGLVGCHTETVPEEKNLEVLNTLDGSTLEKTHEIEYLKFITTYDTGDYDLSRWRITDSKTINMTAKVTNVPEGATILIEHVHIDMSLKSTNPQLDGLSQDSMAFPLSCVIYDLIAFPDGSKIRLKLLSFIECFFPLLLIPSSAPYTPPPKKNCGWL